MAVHSCPPNSQGVDMDTKLYLQEPQYDKHWMLCFRCDDYERLSEVRSKFVEYIFGRDGRKANPFFQIGSSGRTSLIGVEFWTSDQSVILDVCLGLAEVMGEELEL